MRHSGGSLGKVPWFRQNKKLIYFTAFLFICNIFSLMVLFQAIDEKSRCNNGVETSINTFVEQSILAGQQQQQQQQQRSSSSSSSASSYVSSFFSWNSQQSGNDNDNNGNNYNDNTQSNTNTNMNMNLNINSNSNINNEITRKKPINNNGESIQSQLDKLTDENLMPFQRYKKVEYGDSGASASGDKSQQLRKDNENGGAASSNNNNDRDSDNSNELQIENLDSSEIEKYVTNKLVVYNIAPAYELGLHRECSQVNFAKRLPMLTKMIDIHRDTYYFPNYFCPQSYKIEFRPNGLTPHVLGNECAPSWPSDVVYILSQLLNKNMIGIQYGISVSSIWLSLHISQLYAVDSRGDTVSDFQKKIEKTDLDLSNADIQFMRMSKKFVQQVDPSRGQVVDLIVMETVPSFHDDVLKYVVSVLKPNNGILVLRYEWTTPEWIEDNITSIIPPQWKRYDSSIPQKFIQEVPFSQERYIENAKTSVWISNTITKDSNQQEIAKGDPCQT